MKRLNFLSVLTLFFCFSAHAISASVDSQEQNNYFSGSVEYSQFKLAAGAITGNGARVDFSHYFKQNISFDIFLSTAIGADGIGTATSTGLGGYFYYTLFGDFGGLKKTVAIDGTPLLVERMPKKSSLQLGIGLDQFFLNGSEQVYSVSGLGAGVKYQFEMFNQYFEIGARYSEMSTNHLSVQGMFIGLGVLFPL